MGHLDIYNHSDIYSDIGDHPPPLDQHHDLLKETTMFGLLFSKRTEREKELADALRALKTVRVSMYGGISLDSMEILRDKKFIEASKKAQKIVANG